MKTIRVGIIGAGLSGLTCAYSMSQENYLEEIKREHGLEIKLEIEVFEATDRVGGRICTLRQFSSKELYAEAGALSICDTEIEIQELAKELGLELLDRSDRSARKYYSSDTHRLLPSIGSEPSKIFKKYIMDNVLRCKTEEEWLANENNQLLDQCSLIDFLTKKAEENGDNPNEIIKIIKEGFLGLYCDDFSKLSALDALRCMYQYLNYRKVFCVKGGNDRLPEALENAAIKNGVIVRKNTPIVKVIRPFDNAATSVTLISEQGECFTFDYVVIAVPLSALQKIEKDKKENYLEFEPELPVERREAINATSYHRSMARIYYEFNQRFWVNESPVTAMTTLDHPTVWIEDHTAHLPEKSAVLEVHASGDMGKSFQANPNVIKSAKEELYYLWGEEVVNSHLSQTQPVVYLWNENFYQNGIHPYFNVGQAQYPFIIREKLPSISFAGEYTSVLSPASMNGAILSAHRVVKEIKEELVTRLSNFHMESVSPESERIRCNP